MIKAPLKSVFIDFCKNWLVPKAGAALGVYAVLAIVLVHADSDIYAGLHSLMLKIGDHLHRGMLIGIGVVYLAVDIARLWFAWKRPSNLLLKRHRILGKLAAIGLNFLLGGLLVPLTIWGSAIFISDSWNVLWPFIIMLLVYIAVAFALFFQNTLHLNDSKGAAYYLLNTNDPQDCIDVLKAHFDSMPVADPELISSTGTQHLLEVPLLHSHLNPTEKAEFKNLFQSSVKKLQNAGATIQIRFLSKDLSTLLDSPGTGPNLP